MPERYRVSESEFQIIFHDKGMFYANLLTH